jgi:hypothetical protein
MWSDLDQVDLVTSGYFVSANAGKLQKHLPDHCYCARNKSTIGLRKDVHAVYLIRESGTMRFQKFAAFLLTSLAFAVNSGVAGAADAAEKPDAAACLACHGNEGFSMPGADGKPRSLHVTKEKFEKSVHAKLLTCVDCHQDNAQVPHKEGKRAKAECGTCHSAAKDEYLQSVHGQAAVARHNPNAATCTSCHTAH